MSLKISQSNKVFITAILQLRGMNNRVKCSTENNMKVYHKAHKDYLMTYMHLARESLANLESIYKHIAAIHLIKPVEGPI